MSYIVICNITNLILITDKELPLKDVVIPVSRGKDKNYSAFMRMNVKDYTNLWIALVDGKVIAEDKTFKKAYEEAKRIAPKKKPLFAKIPGRKVMIL